MPTFTPLHRDLTFLSPLSETHAARLVSFLAEGEPTTVLDVGCGSGEPLLRVLEAAPGARGLGLDLDEESLAAAREHAVRRGLTDRAGFEARDARAVTGAFDAVTCIGASQIWGPDVAEARPLDYAAALTALRQLLPRGGRPVYGEGIWSAPPTPAATAPLSAALTSTSRSERSWTWPNRMASRSWPCTRPTWTSGTPSSGVHPRLRPMAGRARARPSGCRGGAWARGPAARVVLRRVPRHPRPGLHPAGRRVSAQLTPHRHRRPRSRNRGRQPHRFVRLSGH